MLLPFVGQTSFQSVFLASHLPVKTPQLLYTWATRRATSSWWRTSWWERAGGGTWLVLLSAILSFRVLRGVPSASGKFCSALIRAGYWLGWSWLIAHFYPTTVLVFFPSLQDLIAFLQLHGHHRDQELQRGRPGSGVEWRLPKEVTGDLGIGVYGATAGQGW